MSKHRSVADKSWIHSHREFYTRLGWTFLPRVGGRGTKAIKKVNGVEVCTFSSCCMNRLLIQIKAWEAKRKD